ncbi:type I restriction endonuclease subunit R [Natrarchaeobius oligotrophus]|uniref:Type I restriction endonuclease subunit R n=1 Tax=Natrarchaeobius chitinivorans TaxID=1679083 RepID=A0A3N6PR11_NATCH|nr:DEAD/DEAH box helicase family protein [Natrarchaeobius chitinivorans]RQH01816.1 type I restriction endonuclease subunit R [Natrarchaeobius chitinivorans]
MSKIHDEGNFEDFIASHLVEHGGYERLPSEEFNREQGIFPDVVVSFVKETQPEKWEKLETAYKGNARKRFLQDLTSAMEGRGTLELLRHGLRTTGTTIDLAAFKPNTGLNPEVQERYEANRLGVTQQFYYSTTDPKKSIDLALSVNGIPVATAELKNKFTDQSVINAKAQYKSDRDSGEPALKFKRGALVHFAVDQDEVEYTTELDGDDTHFLPFNKGHDGGAGNPPREDSHRTAYLWEEVWEKDSWMEILQRFIHIDTEEIRKGGVKVDEEETIIFPRYHQLECVRQLVDAAQKSGAGEDYLVQHSTGSGKSKSIAWLVHRLVSLHNDADEAVFDGVVVVTDRTVLDEQLRNTIYELDHKTGVVHAIKGEQGSKSQELAEAIEAGKPVIITTLQTFPHVIEHAKRLPERDYAVVVDEAHSSQSGEMAHEMKQILSGIDIDEDDDAEDLIVKSSETRGNQENLSFFAFTATPKGKTLEAFGTVPEGGDKPEPSHLYSMRQAIEEGFILDVLQHYTTYDTFYNVAKVIKEDPQVPQKKAVKAVSKFLKLHPHNISQKVEIIVEHFREHAQHKIGGKAKAMVVTSSRVHAVRYKKAIDEYIEKNGYDLSALVAFSGTVEDDGFEYTEREMNDGIKESELPSKFDTPEYQVLVVADKYQTGFDQPLLHTMYVDKKLSGIQAVQTLSRLNRTHPGKEDTFVLDFENDREDIYESFEPYYEKTTLEETTDPQHIYQLESDLNASQIYTQQEVDQFAEAFFSPENKGTEQAHAKLSSLIQPARDRFMVANEETQDEFRSQLRSFLRLYKFQSQVVNYSDTTLEKLYTFGRFLYKELPRDSRESRVEFNDELALQYYRLEKSDEGSIELDSSGGGVSSPTETGTGSQEDEEVELSTIVEKINEKLGTDFTEADQLFLDQIKEDALEDDHIRRSAQVNSRENFALEFDDVLTGMFIDRMDQNQDLFAKFMDNDEVQEAITKHLRREVYKESQQANS